VVYVYIAKGMREPCARCCARAQRPSDGGNTGNKSVPLCVSFEGMKMVFVLCIDYC
jgi:hypothetical protein